MFDGLLTCLSTVCRIVATQFLGAPLYWINREMFYAYIALTKQSFALTITTMTQWWGPTTVRISGDASVAGQIKKTPEGLVQFEFPERMVMIANHQVHALPFPLSPSVLQDGPATDGGQTQK